MNDHFYRTKAIQTLAGVLGTNALLLVYWLLNTTQVNQILARIAGDKNLSLGLSVLSFLGFGIPFLFVCSRLAKKEGFRPRLWAVLGLALNVWAYIGLLLLCDRRRNAARLPV